MTKNKTPFALHKRCIYKHGYTCNKNTLLFGSYGFMVIEEGLLYQNQIEATRVAIIKQTKKNGNIWIRIRPNLPLSKKPSEVRMGKGKGPFSEWVYYTQRNEIIFELDGVSFDTVKRAFFEASVKFPYHLKLIKKI